MNRSIVIVAPMTLALLFCKGAQETSTTTVSSTAQASQSTAVPPATTTTVATTTTGATAATVPAASGSSLASQDTNWPGITADVTEFRRKGNTLTAKVRLTNKSSSEAEPGIEWKQVSLLDTAGGKKYEVLKDEKGEAIASNREGWTDRWSARIKPGESQTIWMKFPAPPPDVKSITLQLPKMAPFDDLAIQD